MIFGLFQHLWFILTFKHNGKGLKTSKSFTYVLFLINYIMIELSELPNVTTKNMIFDFLVLFICYKLYDKKVINAILLVCLFYSFLNIFIPYAAFCILIWGIVGIISMQIVMRNLEKKENDNQ